LPPPKVTAAPGKSDFSRSTGGDPDELYRRNNPKKNQLNQFRKKYIYMRRVEFTSYLPVAAAEGAVRTYAWDDEEEMRSRGVPGQMAGRGDALVTGANCDGEEAAEEAIDNGGEEGRRSP